MKGTSHLLFLLYFQGSNLSRKTQKTMSKCLQIYSVAQLTDEFIDGIYVENL